MLIEADLVLQHAKGRLSISTPRPAVLRLQFSNWQTLWAFRKTIRGISGTDNIGPLLIRQAGNIQIYLGKQKLLSLKSNRLGNWMKNWFLKA